MTNALATAILTVMGEVEYATKTGRVTSAGANYTFAGEADLLRVLRPAMVRHGLCMVPVASELHEHHEQVPGRDGKGSRASRTVRIVQTYRLMHVSGEGMSLQVVGEGQDSGDKASAKAMTIALKYALRQAFLIETGDDPDRERPEEPAEPERRERPDDRLFRDQTAAVGELLRALGRTTQGAANALIQEVSEGTLSLHDVESQPGEVLAVLREWRDLQRIRDEENQP